LLCFGCAMIYYVGEIIVHGTGNAPQLARTSTSTVPTRGELLRVYKLPSTFSKEPPHLTPIDPSAIIPKGVHPIDTTHRKGHLHTGNILYVMDASNSLLFLQRSEKVVTCPATWSLLGEHSKVDESAIETVVRGLEEELGFVSLGFDNSGFQGSRTLELHPDNNMEETVAVTLQPVTDFPLYYIRNYGPRNDNRIDRQITHLWSVKFSKNHEEITWHFDDEVKDYKWITLAETLAWLAEDATKYNETFISEGVKDDGPDVGDFCHRTIRTLYGAGLMGMM